jgi:UDP-arabinose 4-epimerase
VMEQALFWAGRAYGLPWAALRYFNAAGSACGVPERHDPETHLIPNLLQAAVTGRPCTLFGTDYPTPDGTAVRDYVHVADLADGHLAAMDHLLAGGESGPFNLGSGHGTSVAEVRAAAERCVGRPLPCAWAGRRPGDPPELVADISRAERVLGFRPRRSEIARIVADAWEALGPAPTRRASN